VAEHDEAQCAAFQAAMDVLAKPWTGLIIRSLEGGPLRFRELGDRVGAIGDRMLTLRLRDLEVRTLVVRHVLPGPPVRVEYALTDLGRGFQKVAGAIQQWGASLLAGQAASNAAAARPVRARRSR
jgi:DNA-binding HxlR family transcriptional regulator